ncbi:hypothetical protein GTP81_24560 [Rugamonas sp. FT107W]|uniref:Periplasmic heavy metal sensor n=1 Tax=Duganella vulcania TaxID=2692166 RepID=A0A845HMA8_9BURK|nr:hypothetical protein [Duganella vulcania]MYN19921.1 hypothetical protein [Duganella vulcania]
MRLNFSSTLQRLAVALALSAALLPAHAVPVMDIRAEDMLPMAAELKKSLNLNANQQILWQQTETKTRNLLRERQARRERLQAATLAGAQGGANVELRDLAKAVDEETTASALEEKLLREWWLTVNDALNETQRQAVVQLVAEQLQRVPDSGAHNGAMPHKQEGGEQHRGGRKGGMGGSVGGPGGASISLPGG